MELFATKIFNDVEVHFFKDIDFDTNKTFWVPCHDLSYCLKYAMNSQNGCTAINYLGRIYPEVFKDNIRYWRSQNYKIRQRAAKYFNLKGIKAICKYSRLATKDDVKKFFEQAFDEFLHPLSSEQLTFENNLPTVEAVQHTQTANNWEAFFRTLPPKMTLQEALAIWDKYYKED